VFGALMRKWWNQTESREVSFWLRHN